MSFYKKINITEPSGGGSETPPYVSSFLVATWGVSGGDYVITILQSVHGKGASPIVEVYEQNGAVFNQVDVAIELSAIGNVTIKITQLPDLRFDGKLTIGG